MQHYSLDRNALLGGIIFRDKSQEVVQLALQNGNETPPYQSDAAILLVVLAGEIAVATDTEKTHCTAWQMLRLAAQERHTIRALADDTHVLVVKQFVG